MNRYLLLLLFLSITIGGRCDNASSWQISNLTLKERRERSRNLQFSVAHDRQSAINVTAEVVLTRIDSSFVAGDKLAVLGDAGRAQAVIVFDLRQAREIDWFFCYEPKRISPQWIVYVEFYPAHSAGYSTDVVLIYDLGKTPSDNCLDSRGAVHLPPSIGDYAVRVGIPVYPESNASQHSYLNEVESPSRSVIVLGPPFFLLLSSKELVFLSHQGRDAHDYITHLIAVDLSKGVSDARTETINLPFDELPRKSNNPNFLHATRLEEVGPRLVRLILPKEDYGVDSLMVHIPGRG